MARGLLLAWGGAGSPIAYGQGAGSVYRQLHRRPHAAPDIEKLQEAQLLGRC